MTTHNCTFSIVAKIQNTDNTERWQQGGTTKTHSLLMGMQNVIATLEGNMAASYQTDPIFFPSHFYFDVVLETECRALALRYISSLSLKQRK